MWRDLETVETPDLPAAKAALKEARASLDNALGKWRGQAARQVELGTPGQPSKYRVKASKDGTSHVIQRRE